MTELSCDYSLARPSPAAIKAAGYVAVWRYLSPNPNAKNLSVSEANALHAAGLGIGLIWETFADRALSGEAGGTADGTAAVAQAKALGAASGCPLLANLGDFKATLAQIPAIQAYYHAFRRVPGFAYQAGGYATRFIIDQLVAHAATGLWWQNAMDDAGVPGSVVSPNAGVYQRVTPTVPHPVAGVDEDVTVNGAYVHWWMPTPPPPPVGEIEGILVQLPDGVSRKVLSADGGRTWQ